MSAATLIKQMRNTAGLTQAGLARRSGVSRTVINAYERGTRDPGAEALARLAEASGQELTVRPRRQLDLARNARVLAEVLDLAELLPHRRRSELTFPPLPQSSP